MGKTVYLDMKKATKLAIFIFIIITALLMYIKIKYQGIRLVLEIKLHIFIYLILFIFAHEVLHGVGFKIFCKAPWQNIKYGFHKEYRVPYCTCRDLMHKRTNFIGVLLLPTIVLGIITLIITYYSKNLLWIFITAYVFSGGSGDIYMAFDVMKYSKSYKFTDHPTEPGYIVYVD